MWTTVFASSDQFSLLTRIFKMVEEKKNACKKENEYDLARRQVPTFIKALHIDHFCTCVCMCIYIRGKDHETSLNDAKKIAWPRCHVLLQQSENKSRRGNGRIWTRVRAVPTHRNRANNTMNNEAYCLFIAVMRNFHRASNFFSSSKRCTVVFNLKSWPKMK